MIGVYKITSPEGKVYIGSSSNIEKRLKYYNSVSCKLQTKLYNSIQKFGYSNHIVEILEECNIKILHQRENYYGLLNDVLGENGLNSVLPKFEDTRIHICEETRIRMSKSKQGSKNSFYGKTHNEETRLKIIKANKGRIHTDEHRLKVSLNNGRAMAKIVIDLNTGVFYTSCKEAALYNNMNHSTLKSQLNGSNPNKTNLRYC